MTYGNLTSNTLIEAVKRKAAIPVSQITFTDDDILAFANEELKIGLVPSIMSVHEEYYVYSAEVSLEANKSDYPIPYRALGGKLRDVAYRDTNGNFVEMSRIPADDKSLYQVAYINTVFMFFYLQGNSIVLTPNVGDSPRGSLFFTFYIRPNDLVGENRVGIIQNISVDSNNGTTTYTLDKVPTGFSTSQLYDLLQAKPGHKIRKYDLTANALNSTNKTITFNTSDLDSETEIGDHISFSGECIIPQCPTDLHMVLAQRVVTRCLEAQGDTQGLNNANTKLQEMEMKTLTVIDQRVEGAPQKVVNNRGLLRSSKIRRRWWM